MSTVEVQIFREQVAVIYRSSILTVMINLILAPIITWRVSVYSESSLIYFWCVAIWLIAILRAVLGLLFHRAAAKHRDDRHWILIFDLMNFVLALTWGALALPIFGGDQTLRLVLFALVVSLPTLAMFSLSSRFQSFFCFLIPLTIMMVLGAYFGGGTLRPELFLLALGLYITNSIAAVRLSENFVQLHRNRLIAQSAQQEAVIANLARARFLANMSHEIRTPINGMMGMAELLRDAKLPPPNDRFANLILGAGQILLGVINDVLDFAKMEEGSLKVKSKTENFREVVELIVSVHRSNAQKKNIEMELQIAPELPEKIEIDRFRLSQILGNLLSNAIKFTSFGKIDVVITKQATIDTKTISVRFQIIDTGHGIDAQDQAKVFLPFFQVDDSMTRKNTGTGLGLAISRELVLLLHGSIGLESQLGCGSNFWFELPLKIPTEAVNLATPVEVQIQQQQLNARILLVEDSPLNFEVARMNLESFGLTIIGASNGLEAVEKALSENPDLILMDCQMPEMDGFEATRIIRARMKHKHIPIIALTAHALREDHQACLDAGMDAYLTKPVASEKLFTALQLWLSKKR